MSLVVLTRTVKPRAPKPAAKRTKTDEEMARRLQQEWALPPARTRRGSLSPEAAPPASPPAPPPAAAPPKRKPSRKEPMSQQSSDEDDFDAVFPARNAAKPAANITIRL